MHQISDGQRRRVQTVMALLDPFRLLLIDEVTVDLDIIVRQNLIKFLKEESDNELNKATIIYATHIFDGLGDFPTHLIHINRGKIQQIFESKNIEFFF
jgi:CCR4-NOT complex subunit CAF16